MDDRKHIEVCFTPGEYEYFKGEYDIVVVIDVLRATSAICAAFDNGVKSIIPVASRFTGRKNDDKELAH